jgi:(p)ppGpp synthase/HD superfamily hydrolase
MVKVYRNVFEAMNWSKSLHEGQRYGDRPYFEGHIMPVNSLVTNHYELNQKVFTDYDAWDGFVITTKAALLHDVIEDCGVTKEEIESLYGTEVADIVWRVTDEPGVNRKERKAKTYPKIKASKRATLIKLCDRLHNMSSSSKMDMYVKEYPGFREALYTPGLFESIWTELDKINAASK